MFRFLAPILLSFLFVSSVFAQGGASNTVTGLELPKDQVARWDEGFVVLTAKCKGEVRWLIVSDGLSPKYITIPNSNSIIVSVPPKGGVISVFAVGVVEGKLTQFARTNIAINPPDKDTGSSKTSKTNKTATQAASKKTLHLTFFVDLNKVSSNLAEMLNSKSLRQGINNKGHWFRLYDIKSPVIDQKRLTNYVSGVGTKTVLVIQDNDGRVLTAQNIPRTEIEIFALISKFSKKWK